MIEYFLFLGAVFLAFLVFGLGFAYMLFRLLCRWLDRNDLVITKRSIEP